MCVSTPSGASLHNSGTSFDVSYLRGTGGWLNTQKTRLLVFVHADDHLFRRRWCQPYPTFRELCTPRYSVPQESELSSPATSTAPSRRDPTFGPKIQASVAATDGGREPGRNERRKCCRIRSITETQPTSYKARRKRLQNLNAAAGSVAVAITGRTTPRITVVTIALGVSVQISPLLPQVQRACPLAPRRRSCPTRPHKEQSTRLVLSLALHLPPSRRCSCRRPLQRIHAQQILQGKVCMRERDLILL